MSRSACKYDTKMLSVFSNTLRYPLLSLSAPVSSPRNTTNAQIGVFDSGVGGLTVLQEIHRQLPQESVLYFGDTARVPYGNREPAEIIQFVREILSMMSKRQVKMAIMACSTGSALAMDIVRDEFEFPIVGVVKPGARAAVAAGRRIGVIATQATVKSQAYSKEIRSCTENAQVWEVACPKFVPLIESNCIDSPEMMVAAREYLQPLIDQDLDTLVFGCTHYPHLKRVFQQILPQHVAYVNPAEAAVIEASHVLAGDDIQADTITVGITHFYVSGSANEFADLATNWLPQRPLVETIPVRDLHV
jgi:glutamate racemase